MAHPNTLLLALTTTAFLAACAGPSDRDAVPVDRPSWSASRAGSEPVAPSAADATITSTVGATSGVTTGSGETKASPSTVTSPVRKPSDESEATSRAARPILAATNGSGTSPSVDARRAASRILTEALANVDAREPAVDASRAAAARSAEDLAREFERWRVAVKEARAVLGDASLNSARLAAAIDVAPSEWANDGARTAKRVRRALEKLAADLVFEPRVEAPRPVGFPSASPVGEVVVLDYPAYRMAKVAMDARGDNGAFWKLFRHIESHEIPMTAPVEMGYGNDGSRERADSMAFLYASSDVGQTGPEGDVRVVDVPAARVVSIGLRGSPTESRVAVAREELRAWLRDHPELVEVGPSRTMGWNSPMVSDAARFTEVQVLAGARDGSVAGRP